MQERQTIKDTKTAEILSEIEVSLKLIFGIKLRKIILFGSYARNNQDIGSDMDIMVLIDMDEEEIKKYREQLLNINVDITTRYGVVLSIITNNHDYFYEWVQHMPFFRNVYNEGVEIYGR